MEPTELMGCIAGVFDRLGVEYAVVGSMASSFYGDARLTNDVDVLANLTLASVPEFLKSFPSDEFYVSEDAVREAILRRSQFNIIHPDSGLKIDVMIPQATGIDELTRRIRVTPHMAAFETYFASPEDVILKKMEFYREGGSDKHVRDISGMLKVGGDKIDRAYISDWSKKLGLSDIWNAIVARIDR